GEGPRAPRAGRDPGPRGAPAPGAAVRVVLSQYAVCTADRFGLRPDLPAG
ncbi:unnamed protein product, partial [Heterosigma akashiwo]